MIPIYTTTISPLSGDVKPKACDCGHEARLDRDFRLGFRVYCPACHKSTRYFIRERDAVGAWDGREERFLIEGKGEIMKQQQVKRELCPYCKKVLTRGELDKLECGDCGHYLIREDGKLRLPKHKDE